MPYSKPEAQKAYNARYREKNRKRLRKYHRKWVAEHKVKVLQDHANWLARQPDGYFNRVMKRSRQRHPVEHKARSATGKAIKAGKLTRSPTCQKCGKQCFTQAHHTDYLSPMDVVWLCVQCHREEHQE